MVWAKPTERIHQVVENFCAAKSARDDVFLYYKIGRWQDVFPEKPYFLLSHCAHILFSLWRVEEEGKEDLYKGAPRPTAFLEGLPFGKLRYTDYKRRLLHGDSLEDHWKNETQWFKFWIEAMEFLDPSKAALYQEFRQQILARVGQSSVLRSKAGRRHCKALSHFVKSDAAAHTLRRTMSILDELMWGIVRCVAGLDPRIHLYDQITLLIGLLSGIRGTIVHQALVKGRYVPSDATRWKAPFSMTRWLLSRKEGTLTLVPKREGGGILCSYSCGSESTGRKRSWIREVSSLTGSYEQELFSTWSYETGEYQEDPGHREGDKACWRLQHEEVWRIETLAQLIDALLATLDRCPQCVALIQEVRSLVRNGRSKWCPQDLPWTYIRRMDQLLDRLTQARRQIGSVSEHPLAEACPPAIVSASEEIICKVNSAEPADGTEVVENNGSTKQDLPSVCSITCESENALVAASEPDPMTVSSLKETVAQENVVPQDREADVGPTMADSSDSTASPLLKETSLLCLPAGGTAADLLLSEASDSIVKTVDISESPGNSAVVNETAPVGKEPREESPVPKPIGENDSLSPRVWDLPVVSSPQADLDISAPAVNVPAVEEPKALAVSDPPRVRRPRQARQRSHGVETADRAKRTRSKKGMKTAVVVVTQEVFSQHSDPSPDQGIVTAEPASEAVEPSVLTRVAGAAAGKTRPRPRKRTAEPKQSGAKSATPRKTRSVRAKVKKIETADQVPVGTSTHAFSEKSRRTAGRKITSAGSKRTGKVVASSRRSGSTKAAKAVAVSSS